MVRWVGFNCGWLVGCERVGVDAAPLSVDISLKIVNFSLNFDLEQKLFVEEYNFRYNRIKSLSIYFLNLLKFYNIGLDG